MAKRSITLERLDIAKSPKEQLDRYKRGVHLEKVTGKSIDELKADACKARYHLARRFLTYAKVAIKKHPNNSRLVIGRSYYAMYHAARAIVYWQHGGDDHEAHSDLPNHLPADFPDQAIWKNSLRNARLDRNRADYDPFPVSEAAYATVAQSVFDDCKSFLARTKSYLISKKVSL